VNWDAWTGIGTIALAAMTLAAVVTTIVVTAQDRRRTDERLTAERERANEERRHALEQEQLAEAWAVEVDMRQSRYSPKEGEETRRLFLAVANRGRFTITRLEARFCTDGTAVSAPEKSERELPNEVRVMGLVREEGAMSGILRGWGEAMRFDSEVLPVAQLKDPYPLVRWTDRWGTRWEHRLGTVRKISSDAEWNP
jgi:hypothetical protein